MPSDLLTKVAGAHAKAAMVATVASKDPWTLHGGEHVCIGCLQIFLGIWTAGIPKVMTMEDAASLLASGEYNEEGERPWTM